MNKSSIYAGCLMFIMCIGGARASMITFEFSQGGFAGGGTVSGIIKATDLNGDGRIYAASRIIDTFPFFPIDYEFGNELDYVEVVFSGFQGAPGPQTIIYDKSTADMESPINAFMAFAYNLDGGALGDDADEGISFARFADSTNFWLGDFFAPLFENDTTQSVGICDGLNVCGGVIGYEQDNSPQGASVVYEDYTTATLQLSRVSEPAVLGSLIGALAFLGLQRRRQRQAP